MVWSSIFSVAAQSQAIQWSSVRCLELTVSHMETHRGRLDRQQAEDVLKQLCPQAEIVIWRYEVGE